MLHILLRNRDCSICKPHLVLASITSCLANRTYWPFPRLSTFVVINSFVRQHSYYQGPCRTGCTLQSCLPPSPLNLSYTKLSLFPKAMPPLWPSGFCLWKCSETAEPRKRRGVEPRGKWVLDRRKKRGEIWDFDCMFSTARGESIPFSFPRVFIW